MTRRNEVLQRLRTLIASDKYPPGRRLPPERDLAAEMAVSRGALRRALAILEGEGLVWRHVGKGTFVGQRPEAPNAAALVGATMQNAESVLEVRSILEPAVARLAAERASSTDVARMKSHLQAALGSADTETFNLHCDMLHRSIARATHNAILLRLYDALSPIRSLAHAVGEHAELTQDEMKHYWREHADIIDAIVSNDGGAAEAAMKRHIRHVWTDTPDTHWRDGAAETPQAPIPARTALEIALFRPTLLELVEGYAETAYLAMLRDNEIEIVDAVVPRSRGRVSMHPGMGPRPVDKCAAAQAILAFQSPERCDAVFQNAEIEIDRPAMDALFSEIRRNGYALSDETLGAGTYSVAIPVRLNGGVVRFSIGLFGPKSGMQSVYTKSFADGIQGAIENTVGRLGDVLNALSPYLGNDGDASMAARG